MQANERTDKRVAQYLRLYFWLIQTIVQWERHESNSSKFDPGEIFWRDGSKWREPIRKRHLCYGDNQSNTSWGDPVSEWGQLVAWQLPEGFLYDKSQSGHGHTLFGGLFGCVHASLQEYVTRRSVDSYGCLEASLCQSMVKRIETASNGRTNNLQKSRKEFMYIS